MALSARGQHFAAEGEGQLIWTVIKDLWDPKTNPDGYVSLGVAENSLMHEELSNYIHENISLPLNGLTYGDGGAGSRELQAAMARFLTRKLKPVVTIQAFHITVTNGVSTAIEHVSSIFADQEDAFLLGQPYYGAFPHDIELRTGVELVPVPFDGKDPLSLDGVRAYEKAIEACHKKGQRVAGLMLCNPHNPLGRCYSREVIIELMKLCQKHKIHLVSDEIYANSVWRTSDPEDSTVIPFTSLSSIPTEAIIDPALIHMLYGISKDFGANGLRIGCIVSQHNAGLRKAMIPLSIYSYASSLSESIVTQLLSDDEYVDWYITENNSRLKANYELLTAWARKHKIPYAKGSNAAFFLWVDFGKILSTSSISKQHQQNGQATVQIQDSPAGTSNVERVNEASRLTATINDALLEEKVFLATGTSFGSEEPGWFRIVFSQQHDILKEGLRRIEKSLKLDDDLSRNEMAKDIA